MLLAAHTDGASIVRAGLAGGDTVMVGVTTSGFTQKLLGQPTVPRPEDLRGKRLGVTRAGSVTDFAARYLLGRLGLSADGDVALIQTGGYPEMLQAMMAGGLDAGLISDPVAQEALDQGFVPLLDLASLNVEYPTNGIGTLHSIVNDRPGAMRAFIGGIVDGIAWAKHNRAEALGVLSRYTRVESPRALEAAYEEAVPRMPAALYPTEAAIVVILEAIRDTEPRAAQAQPADFVEARFVRELDESGYIRRLDP